MSKRIFTKEEVEALLQNRNVERCSEKSITYNKDFKLAAVKQYHEQGMTSREIFKQAGFNIDTIGRHQPKECLQRWKKSFQKKGLEGLEDTRGRLGRPKKEERNEAETIKWLEADVAYLKAENDFLARLRAKRRE